MTECDLSQDRHWEGQWYCGIHGVWFRHEHTPDQCPAGQAYFEGYADGQAEKRPDDELVAGILETLRHISTLDPHVSAVRALTESTTGRSFPELSDVSNVLHTLMHSKRTYINQLIELQMKQVPVVALLEPIENTLRATEKWPVEKMPLTDAERTVFNVDMEKRNVELTKLYQYLQLFKEKT